MTNVKINIKWNKDILKNIDVDTTVQPRVLKAQLFALTNVPIERQRLFAKGQTISDHSWGKIRLTNGMTLLMMGSIDSVPTLNTTDTKSSEASSESQSDESLKYPGGLKNLGNTCYMNATLQCLKCVPELSDALKEFRPRNTRVSGDSIVIANESNLILNALKSTYNEINKRSDPFMPLEFLSTFHNAHPIFAERDKHGYLIQHDANEFWMQLMHIFQMNLPGRNVNEALEATNSISLVEQYFGIKTQSIMKCNETNDEEPTITNECMLQLSCFINSDVKYLITGLKNKLEEHIIKHSITLNHDTIYTKTTRISRLPAYLTIQFIRFFYKEKEKTNAKILKDVQYSIILDVFGLCTPELQERLLPMREKIKLAEDAKLNRERAIKLGESIAEINNSSILPMSFDDDIGSNNCGFYQLNAVLTHKGRSSSSGHYVAWVRQKNNEWLMFDDENVVAIPEENIMKLSGGSGDWHTAYVVIYGPRMIESEIHVNDNDSNKIKSVEE